MLVISDTSPITNLIRIGQLELLKMLFEEVVIPQKVYEELSVYEHHQEAIDSRSWIVRKTVQDKESVEALVPALDPGEAEAIILAKELQATFLAIDERKGRKFAEAHGLRIIGLLGVLIQAKKKGYIDLLRPILDTLIDRIGFRVSRQLYVRILAEVGE